MEAGASPRTLEPEETEERPPAVAQYETRPGRTVFTERENTDGWIATDVTVSLRR